MAVSQKTSQTNEKTCANCGGKISAKAKFCTHCGEKLTIDPVAFPKIVETQAERQVKQQVLSELIKVAQPNYNPTRSEINELFQKVSEQTLSNDELRGLLISLLEHPFQPLRDQAAQRLSSDEKGVVYLLQLLEKSPLWQKVSVIRALSSAKIKQAIPTLVHFFELSDDLWLKKEILLAFTEYQDVQPFNTIIRALDSTDPEIVQTAAKALQAIGDPAAIQYLIAKLITTDPSTLSVLQDSIRSFGPKALTQLLKSLLQIKYSLQFKQRILEILITLPDPMAVPLILNFLEQVPDSAEFLIKIMAAWKMADFIPVLKKLTQHEEREIRVAAEIALKQFNLLK